MDDRDVSPWNTHLAPIQDQWSLALEAISKRLTPEMRPVVERLLSMQGGADESGPWYPLACALDCHDDGDMVSPHPLAMLQRVARFATAGGFGKGTYYGDVRWEPGSLTAWLDYLDESEWAEPRRPWTLADWGFGEP